MTKTRIKGIEIKTEASRSMRVFGIFAKELAFGAFYLTLFSALPESLSRLLAVFIGIAFSAVYLVFRKNKIVKFSVLGAAVLYTVLCIAIFFGSFYGGLISFLNGFVSTANANMHWGFASFNGAEQTVLGDFLFSSVISVWLAMAVAEFGKGYIFIPFSAVALIVWLFLGLYPSGYALVPLAFSYVCLLTSDCGFNIKATLCYLLCSAVLFGLLAPCFLYSGSDGVKDLRNGISSSVEHLFFGKDGLPEGKLKQSGNMRSSEDLMLEVELSSQTRNLYLKGFVGSELDGSEWKTTDKNVYVQNDYQGLLDFVEEGGLPFSQYAKYSELSGRTEKLDITVKNVSANSRYVYTPYTADGITAGISNYDMNVYGGLFTSSEYSFKAYTRNRNCEWISQAQWLLNAGTRTPEMAEYLVYEGEYRAFVSDVYRAVDDSFKSIISPSIINIGGGSINTVTQLIRRYFIDNYEYSDVPDGISTDFISDFFGKSINRANSAYFASAATYMFREYGYPARYAEGYFIRLETAVNTSVLPVTGKNSHAWTEVYFDGIGWLPVEVTPTFFSEEEMETPPVSDNDNKPDVPEIPDTPPEDPEDPEKPDDPNDPTREPLKPEEQQLLLALQILTPIFSVALAAVTVILILILNRFVKLNRKRKKMDAEGEAFGRAVYTIMERDCKPFGGFSAETLQKYGISEKSTKRFIQLIEKSVYGGYNLSVNEKYFINDYINGVSTAVTNSGGALKRFYCKYIKCLGI